VTVLSVLTESLGGSTLAQQAIAGRDASGWLVARPAGADAWRSRAEAARSAVPATWAQALAPALGAGAARVAQLAAEGGVVVTTGQQPGLLGGPLYTLHKALTARALAAAIERATGVRAMAVFWAATDDADIEEARMVMVAGPAGAVHFAGPANGVDGQVMATRPLGDVRAAVLAAITAAGGDADPALLRALEAAYVDSHTVGDAYVTLLRALLEPLGVSVLDAYHLATRTAATPHLVRALAGAADVAHAVHARDLAITVAGYSTQVAEVEGLSLVFALTDGIKQRIPLAEAAARASSAAPGSLSANVLLRPVLEAALMPTVAYVAGPGELSYFAQATAVAGALGMRAPLGVPRWSGTVIEPQVARMLARRQLTLAELADPHAAETTRARATLDEQARAALARLRAAADAESGVLASLVPPGVPARSVEGMRHQLHHRIDRMERRFAAAAKRADSELMRDLATVRGALRPAGGRQERALAWFPYVARHGEALLGLLEEQMEVHAQHLVGATG
jgi:bacillithiol biosynthesis cysteine-adding enzyme BshC